MKISKELSQKIETLLQNDNELKTKLLSGDPEAIQKIGIISQRGIEPKEIIEAYENNTMDNLYKHAKKMVELNKLYQELCFLYVKRHDNDLEER